MGGCATAAEALPWTAEVKPVWITSLSIDYAKAYTLSACYCICCVSMVNVCFVLYRASAKDPSSLYSICYPHCGPHCDRLAVSLIECLDLDG